MSWGQKTREREQRAAEKQRREQEIRQQQAQQKQEKTQQKEVTERQRNLNLRSERAAQARIESTRIREDAKTQRMQMRMQNAQARRAARAANRGSGGAPTVAGAIMGSIVASVLLFAVIVSTGPLVDYFQVWLTQQNGNPYAAPVLDLFTWIYILAFVSWITYIIVVWRAVTMNVSYGVYD